MPLPSSQSILTLFGLLMAGWLGACVSQGAPVESEASGREMGGLVEFQTSGPADLSLRKRKPVDLTLVQPELEPRKPRARGPRFTLAAEDVDVRTVLLTLSQQVEHNIIVDPGISQTVTVDLKEVTLPELLDSLLQPIRLKYSIERNFIRVTEEKMETRVFHLNYIISRRQGASGLRSLSLQESVGRIELSRDFSMTTAGADSVIPVSTGTGHWTSSVSSSEETDMWGEIASGLERIIGEVLEDTSKAAGKNAKGDASYFVVNKQAGVIIVRNFPDVLVQVAEFLEAVEGSAQRQVFIQARIIEVVLHDDFRSGIDWAQVDPLVTSYPEKKTPAGPVRRGGFGLNYGIGYVPADLVIDALSRQGRVNILSSPKIATLNNQRVVIKVGTEDILFIPKMEPTSTAAATEFIASPLTVGVVLDILPQISANGEVMLSINTSISEKIEGTVSPAVANPASIVDVRESNNIVLATTGQTVLIGGLLRSKIKRTDEALPLLGHIPILGELFHRKIESEERSELVIMLTPEIVAGRAMEEFLY